uniref:Glucose-methanol-choline oxidoreductase C-terminal domain-containing protein n=1 Tax=Timema poppense TaxID=170557 RepID=A0A7R9CWI4_TIMPO|nr:unnamed protein product [Timema poppensis]
MEGGGKAVALGESAAFQRYNSTLYRAPYPGCGSFEHGTDQYWACAIRQLTTSLHHQWGLPGHKEGDTEPMVRTPMLECTVFFTPCLRYRRQLPVATEPLVGTCRMGPPEDPATVVDTQLRVLGVQGLRVADCSIIPLIPASHTMAPAYMIGEKVAKIIKQEWGNALTLSLTALGSLRLPARLGPVCTRSVTSDLVTRDPESRNLECLMAALYTRAYSTRMTNAGRVLFNDVCSLYHATHTGEHVGKGVSFVYPSFMVTKLSGLEFLLGVQTVCPRSLSFVLVSEPNPRVVSFLMDGLLYGAKIIEHSRRDYTRVEITEFKHTERGKFAVLEASIVFWQGLGVSILFYMSMLLLRRVVVHSGKMQH